MVDLRFTNKGATPANASTGEAHIVVVTDNRIKEETVLPRSFAATEQRSLSVIPRDGQHNIRAVMPSPLSQADFDAIRAGQKFLVVHGVVEYQDVFGLPAANAICFFAVAQQFQNVRPKQQPDRVEPLCFWFEATGSAVL